MTAPRTVIIAIPEAMDNFDVLGCRYPMKEGVDVVIIRHPLVNVRRDAVLCNFDLVFDDGSFDINFADFLPPHRVIKHRRYSKLVQMLRLMNTVQQYERDKSIDVSMATKYMSVPTWQIGSTARRNPVLTQETVIIKPQYGARGIGRFRIDGRRVNIHHFQQELLGFFDESTDFVGFDAFMARWGGHVSYCTKGEFHPNEGLESLKELGMVVQTHIDNVAHEYRLITGGRGLPVYTQKRHITTQGNGLHHVTGKLDVLSTLDELTYGGVFESTSDRHLFEYLCINAIGALSSVDVFFTEDGHWGIFEYCNQFGIAGIPQDTTWKLHANYVKYRVEQYLKIEQ